MKQLFYKLYDYIRKNIKEIIINIIIISIILFVGFFKLPYVVYKPGGTISLSDRIYINDNKVDTNNYNLAYVSVARGNIPSILASFIIKDWDIKKINEVTINNTDFDTTLELEKIDMKNSINKAIFVAYSKAGKEVKAKNEKNIIYAIDKNANTDIELFDEIIEIDNKKYDDITKFKEYIRSLNVGDKVSLKVINKEKEYNRYAYVYEIEGIKVIGIVINAIVDLDTDPKIEIKSKKSEAGSSGGLMLTLAIYDGLTDDSISKGKKIVGTGTIEVDGTVGEIGGIKYKLLGAQKGKADIFFVPEENYEEAKEIYDKYKLSFDLVMVKTFDDAINYLNNME